MVNCLKSLAQKQKISIISTIHQPNSEVIQMFDSLYVLAKGGVCVYSGTPQLLPFYMRKNGINWGRDQVPIETLITIASKGFEDIKIREFRNKTTFEMKNLIEKRILETEEKLIRHRSKWFNIKDVYYLLNRKVVEFFRYKFLSVLLGILVQIFTVVLSTQAFPSKFGEYTDCMSFLTPDNSSCYDLLESEIMVQKNMAFSLYMPWMLLCVQIVITLSDKILRLRVFSNEHQNS